MAARCVQEDRICQQWLRGFLFPDYLAMGIASSIIAGVIAVFAASDGGTMTALVSNGNPMAALLERLTSSIENAASGAAGDRGSSGLIRMVSSRLGPMTIPVLIGLAFGFTAFLIFHIANLAVYLFPMLSPRWRRLASWGAIDATAAQLRNELAGIGFTGLATGLDAGYVKRCLREQPCTITQHYLITRTLLKKPVIYNLDLLESVEPIERTGTRKRFLYRDGSRFTMDTRRYPLTAACIRSAGLRSDRYAMRRARRGCIR